MTHRFYALFFVLLFALSVYGQSKFKVESDLYPKFYVEDVLLGNGITAANFKFVGKLGGVGLFETDSTLFPLHRGLVMSTGHVDSVFTANNTTAFTSSKILPELKRDKRKALKGDRDLSRLCKSFARDVVVLEFDFVPTGNVINFNYIFASEEYPEYAGAKFNDAFAFFLSGPDIKKRENLAHLPDTNLTIGVSNINHKENEEFYIKNGTWSKRILGNIRRFVSSSKKDILLDNFQFDGYTKTLTATRFVVPYNKYRIKLVIADAVDEIYDSSIFIEANSFKSSADPNGPNYDIIDSLSKTNDIDSLLGLKIYKPIVEIPEPEIEEEFELTEVYFDNNSSSVKPVHKRELNKLYKYLSNHQNISCHLHGYANNKGSRRYNQKLSAERANSVMNYLLELGIEERRLNFEGFSFDNPKYDNDTADGARKNRRVEIILEFDSDETN